MGSFNKVGFLSSLPIEAGNETVLIFMSSQNSKEIGGVVYPQDLFQPTFLPIFGDYDDYGRIESVKKSSIVSYIEKFFGEDIDSIIEKVDDNSVGRGGSKETIKNVNVFKRLTFGLEHKSVYDKLAAECRIKISDYAVSLKRHVTTHLMRYGRDLKLDGLGFSDFGASRSHVESFIKEVGEKEIMEFLSFNMGMHIMNSKYFPSNYGSQSQDHVLHYKMLTHYRNLIVQRLTEYDEPEKILKELQTEVRDEKLTDILK